MQGVHLCAHVLFFEDRQHAGDVGVGLYQRHARLEACERRVTEVRRRPDQIELQRQDQIHGRSVEREREPRGHHADHFARPGVDRDHTSDDSRVAAKPALPVAIGQNHRLRRAWLIVSS